MNNQPPPLTKKKVCLKETLPTHGRTHLPTQTQTLYAYVILRKSHRLLRIPSPAPLLPLHLQKETI